MEVSGVIVMLEVWAFVRERKRARMGRVRDGEGCIVVVTVDLVWFVLFLARICGVFVCKCI